MEVGLESNSAGDNSSERRLSAPLLTNRQSELSSFQSGRCDVLNNCMNRPAEWIVELFGRWAVTWVIIGVSVALVTWDLTDESLFGSQHSYMSTMQCSPDPLGEPCTVWACHWLRHRFSNSLYRCVPRGQVIGFCIALYWVFVSHMVCQWTQRQRSGLSLHSSEQSEFLTEFINYGMIWAIIPMQLLRAAALSMQDPGIVGALDDSVTVWTLIRAMLFYAAPFPSRAQSYRTGNVAFCCCLIALTQGILLVEYTPHRRAWRSLLLALLLGFVAAASIFQKHARKLRPTCGGAVKVLRWGWRMAMMNPSAADEFLDHVATARTQTGFWSTFACLCWAVQHLVQSAIMFMVHAKYSETADTCSHTANVLSCFHEFLMLVLEYLIPLALFIEVGCYFGYWSGRIQTATVNTFGELQYGRYLVPTSDWQHEMWVASGSQGDVFRAEMRADGSSVCVKKPALDDFENFEEMLKEIMILVHISERRSEQPHRGAGHIVQLVGFCLELGSIAILTRYCDDGELHKALMASDSEDAVDFDWRHSRDTSRGLSLSVRVGWALDIAKGLECLHEYNVAHLDVKTENCLLHNGQALLTDFGCAVVSVSDSTYFSSNAGTLAYMAPEVRSETFSQAQLRFDPFKADVYSYGFLLYECITSRQEPRCSAQPNRMLMHLEDGEMDGPWGATPNEILQIVTKCFAIRPVARPRFEEIVRILNEFEGVEHI